jgi:hypothetical protein
MMEREDEFFEWEAIYVFGSEKPVAWVRTDLNRAYPPYMREYNRAFVIVEQV